MNKKGNITSNVMCILLCGLGIHFKILEGNSYTWSIKWFNFKFRI